MITLEQSAIKDFSYVLMYIFYLDLFLYTRNLLNKRLKPVFEYKSHVLNLCSSAVNSQGLLCSKKIWCEIFVLKLSDIHILLSSF